MRKFTKYPSNYVKASSDNLDYQDSPITNVSQDFKAIAFQQPQGEIYGESFSHVFEVVCICSYEEDEEEYWTEGQQYFCGTDDGESFYIETNLDGLGCIGPYNMINDISEYFRIVSTV